MPNCDCELRFHKIRKLVNNCQRKRGVFKRTGAKRIDSVVAEHQQAEMKKEELSNTAEKEVVEDEIDTESNNSPLS